MLPKLNHLWQSAVARIRLGSALEPSLWLTFIVLLFSTIGAIFARGVAQIFLLGLAIIPLTLFAVGFIYLLIKDPDKLRSQVAEFSKQLLSRIQEKGGIELEEKEVTFIENPLTMEDKLLKNGNGE